MRIIDMHCDTISELLNRKRVGKEATLRKNNMHLDLERMQRSGYVLQNFAMYVDLKGCEDPWEEVCAMHKLYREEMATNADLICPVLQYEDICANEAAGQMSALLTVEEGAVCKGDINKLRGLYDMGVRMLTLTWNYPNELGHPNRDKRRKGLADYYFTPNVEDGLTETGREFVAEMECLGMIVDVSHLSDRGFYDVLECTNKPFVASHSNARAVCGHVRNLTDDMIHRLADRGGCTGLNYYADFLKTVPAGESNFGSIEDMVSHVKHIVKIGGVEVLGLGSDFDGIDTNEALPGAQCMGRLWDALCDAGFHESQLDKIFYGNVLRVYREVL